MMKKLAFILFACSLSVSLFSQQSDSVIVHNLFITSLKSDAAYENLRYLTQTIGPRLAGSPQSIAAVEWAKQVMQQMGVDTVYLQPCKVRNWQRGGKETAIVTSTLRGSKNLNICSYGGSVGTGKEGITAEVVEVKSFEEVEKLGRKGIEGRIVFFDRPADPAFFYTGHSYGSAVDQRIHGASVAAKYGALASIVRSVTLARDEFPHTGVMHYDESIAKIPSIALSTLDAELLSTWLKSDPKLKLFLQTNCRELPEADSYNLIGELKGTDFPDQYIVVGGHIDSWDITQGAHDDGAGVVQSIEVLRLFNEMGIKPRHTVRAVIYMDEEMAQRGAHKYLEEVKRKNEKHIAAIESDGGGFTPIGFSIDASADNFSTIKSFQKYFEEFDMHEFIKGGSGVDVGPLKELGIPLMGLMDDGQRYFDYHHAASDTFDKVNCRELELGAAAMASMVYLLDK